MEQEILQLLQQSPGRAFSIKEVSKMLDRKQFREDPNWSRHTLHALENRKLIKKDQDGRYYAL